MRDFFTPKKNKDGCGCGDANTSQNDKKGCDGCDCDDELDCGGDCDCHDNNTDDCGC